VKDTCPRQWVAKASFRVLNDSVRMLVIDRVFLPV